MAFAMDETNFWKLIDETRGADKSQQLDQITQKLARMTRPERKQFEAFLRSNVAAANKGELWSAAVLLNGGWCSDDCFLYFRLWLVSKGERIFRSALEQPDSLDEVVGTHLTTGSCQFEELLYAVKADENSDAWPLEFAFDWRAYTDEHMKRALPSLWKRLGAEKVRRDEVFKKEAEASYVTQLDVPPFGVIRVGDKLLHVTHNVGKILRISKGRIAIAQVEFDGEVRPVALTPDVVKEIFR